MEIKWLGKNGFEIKGEKAHIFINPPAEITTTENEIILLVRKEDTKKIKALKIFHLPGEYEIREVPLLGFQSHTSEGEDKKLNTIFYFEIDKIKICHLGNIGHAIPQDALKDIGEVDILIIAAGSASNLGVKAGIEVVESIDPRILIPADAEKNGDFIHELGADGVERVTSFQLKARTNLPETDRLYVIFKSE